MYPLYTNAPGKARTLEPTEDTVKKQTFGFLFALLLAIGLMPGAGANAADTEPRVLKPTFSIMITRYLRYFPTPTAKEPQYNTWSWRPRFNFTVEGPLESGSQLSISFFKPNGAPWLTMPLEAKEIPAGQTVPVVNPNDTTEDAERHTTLLTGVFTFKINLKNPLSGTNKTLYSGKFTVGKFHVGPDVPVNKNQFDYYVQHDWLMPIGYMFWNTAPDDEAPQLQSLMWFRGELQPEQVSAYLYYNGKVICSTANSEQGSSYRRLTLETPSGDPGYKWGGFLFRFSKVAVTNKMISANHEYPGTHFLDKNPGKYEIKVLVKGQLARTTSFTVGPDGKIVDNGIAAANNMAGLGIVLPVKIVPGADVKVISPTLKADAFYGNPMTGFVIPG